MKKVFFLLSWIAIGQISCNPGPLKKEVVAETPRALEDKSRLSDVSYKRGNGDLVEELYAELEEKSPELKKIGEEIALLNSSKDDSSKTFLAFNQKNQSYFSSADSHGTQIQDSVLKNKMKILISEYLNNYDISIRKQTQLLETIDRKSASLRDLHIALRIVKTLPAMAKFQKDKMPSAAPLDGYNDGMDKTIGEIEKQIAN